MGKQPEDVGLDERQFQDLNRQFFSGLHPPHAFLMHRLQAAILMASGSKHVDAALADGLQVGELKSVGNLIRDYEDSQGRELFIALEAIVLSHHAAETLLRLFLAMTGPDADCPWLGVARLRGSGIFPKRVRHLQSTLRTPGVQRDLGRCFYGRGSSTKPPEGVTSEAYADALRGLTLLVAQCCELVLDEVNLYNSAKHGLSALPGDASASFPGSGGDALLKTEGPSLTLLEAVVEGTREAKRWHQSTHWIPADRRLTLTYVIAEQTENLWEVGRNRYLPGVSDKTLKPLKSATMEYIISPPVPEGGPGYRIEVPWMRTALRYKPDTASTRAATANAANRNRKRR